MTLTTIFNDWNALFSPHILLYTHHIVKTNGINGNMCEINHGVPILFILYTNEICDINIEGSIVTYEDDVCLHFSHNTWEGLCEKSINGFRKALQILKERNLSSNIEKNSVYSFLY